MLVVLVSRGVTSSIETVNRKREEVCGKREEKRTEKKRKKERKKAQFNITQFLRAHNRRDDVEFTQDEWKAPN